MLLEIHGQRVVYIMYIISSSPGALFGDLCFNVCTMSSCVNGVNSYGIVGSATTGNHDNFDKSIVFSVEYFSL